MCLTSPGTSSTTGPEVTNVCKLIIAFKDGSDTEVLCANEDEAREYLRKEHKPMLGWEIKPLGNSS